MRTCKIVDIAVPVGHRVELKESEKKDKCLDLARELEKTVKNENDVYTNYEWGALGTVAERLLKGLEDLEIRGRVETIQITTILRSDRILRRVEETWGDLLSFKPQWKTIS